MKKIALIRVLGVSFGIAATLMASAVPVSIAYQGVLRNAKGDPVSPLQQTIEFRLYSTASGALSEALWGRSVAVLLDTNGLFNVALEDGNGSVLESTAHTNLVSALRAARSGTLFVGLNVVGSSGEISPRQKILMVPYAAFAQDVDAAAGDFTVGGRAMVRNLAVGEGATFKGAVQFETNVSVVKKLTVSGGLEVVAPQAIEGYGTIPIGGIIMWSGSVIPDGWALCDGSNGTPDLRGRFVKGARTLGENGKEGGAESVALKTDNLPPHRHEYYGDDQLEGRDRETTMVSRYDSGYDADSKLKGSSKVYLSGSTGSGKAFDIQPPYYQLAFIMRVK